MMRLPLSDYVAFALILGMAVWACTINWPAANAALAAWWR